MRLVNDPMHPIVVRVLFVLLGTIVAFRPIWEVPSWVSLHHIGTAVI
jgi:hypothetical protein